jgi:hypothetical protein
MLTTKCISTKLEPIINLYLPPITLTKFNKDVYIKTNSVAFSPQANYTDWATATCRRNLVPTFMDRGVSHGQRGGSPTIVNLSFLDRKMCIYQVYNVFNHLPQTIKILATDERSFKSALRRFLYHSLYSMNGYYQYTWR